MKAKELEGKLAIRTKPVILRINDFLNPTKDYSYTTSPIKILKVTENHILYSYEGTYEEKIFNKEIHILDNRWIDDNWVSYDELISLRGE